MCLEVDHITRRSIRGRSGKKLSSKPQFYARPWLSRAQNWIFSIMPLNFCLIMCKCVRGGVKLEFVWNSFDSIQKFTIWLIQKGKKVRKIRKFSIWNSFDSKENNSKNSQIFQILFSDSKNSKFFPSQKTFWAIQFWVMALWGYCQVVSVSIWSSLDHLDFK